MLPTKDPAGSLFPHISHSTPAAQQTGLFLLQAQVDEWIKTIGQRYFSELTNMAILTEEVGEVARLIARTYGEQSFKTNAEKQELPEELADVLFVLLCLANQTGINLQTAFDERMHRKTQRDAKRHANNPKLKNPPIT